MPQFVELTILTDNASGHVRGHSKRRRHLGGKFADRLFGRKGRDELDGRGGDDALAGGPGADASMGGPASDRLSGDSGDDRLRGEDGSDFLEGGRRPGHAGWRPADDGSGRPLAGHLGRRRGTRTALGRGRRGHVRVQAAPATTRSWISSRARTGSTLPRWSCTGSGSQQDTTDEGWAVARVRGVEIMFHEVTWSELGDEDFIL